MNKKIGSMKRGQGRHSRTDEQTERDRSFASDLFLKGYSYRRIAEAINERNKSDEVPYTVTYQTVYNDIQFCLTQWKREQFDNIDQYITQELQSLDNVAREAWEEWEKSKRPKCKTKYILGKAKEVQKETTTGDPSFLNVVLNVQQRKARLLGYDSPLCINLVGDKEKEKHKYDFSDVPEDVLEQLADSLQNTEGKK